VSVFRASVVGALLFPALLAPAHTGSGQSYEPTWESLAEYAYPHGPAWTGSRV